MGSIRTGTISAGARSHSPTAAGSRGDGPLVGRTPGRSEHVPLGMAIDEALPGVDRQVAHDARPSGEGEIGVHLRERTGVVMLASFLR
jgi:hypothetical protein